MINKAKFVNSVMGKTQDKIIHNERIVDEAYDTEDFQNVFNQYYEETKILYKFLQVMEVNYNVCSLR